MLTSQCRNSITFNPCNSSPAEWNRKKLFLCVFPLFKPSQNSSALMKFLSLHGDQFGVKWLHKASEKFTHWNRFTAFFCRRMKRLWFHGKVWWNRKITMWNDNEFRALNWCLSTQQVILKVLLIRLKFYFFRSEHENVKTSRLVSHLAKCPNTAPNSTDNKSPRNCRKWVNSAIASSKQL